jgi:protein-tyrosine phosphatase
MSIRIGKIVLAVAAAIAVGPLAGCAHNGATQKIPFTEANAIAGDATHNPDGTLGKGYTVSWSAPDAGTVRVYAGTDPAKVGRYLLVGDGGEMGKVDVSVPPKDPSGKSLRWYFELTPERGAPLVIAERSLMLASAPNFRDAGGYRTMDGQWVRMGLLYRSDQLDRLSPDDLETLHGDRLHLVCDLRTDAERKQGMDKLPAGAQAMIADVAGGDSATNAIVKLLSGHGNPKQILGDGKAAKFMADANRQFVESPTAKAAYKALFERLADPKSLPATFHCTAGKDRTGWAEAVFLSIMGVPRETILQDYLLSNDYLKAKNDKMLAALKGKIDPSLIQPLMEVRPDYLQAGFDAADKNYGSMDGYIRNGIGLSDATIQALRSEFLAGA